MVCDNDADVAVFKFGDDILNIFHGDGVNAGEGFVQENELGVYGKGTGNLAAAAFTSGELNAQGFADLGEIELVYKAFHAGHALFLGHILCGR